MPVIYLLDDDVGEVGTSGWDVHPAIAPAPGDLRIRKQACDAFHETELPVRLDERAIGHLVIAGCKTPSAAQIIAHHTRTLDGFGAYVNDRVCEIVARPAAEIAFDVAVDVPSSGERRA